MKKFTLKCNKCGSEKTDIISSTHYDLPIYYIECDDCGNKADSIDETVNQS